MSVESRKSYLVDILLEIKQYATKQMSGNVCKIFLIFTPLMTKILIFKPPNFLATSRIQILDTDFFLFVVLLLGEEEFYSPKYQLYTYLYDTYVGQIHLPLIGTLMDDSSIK